jgi:predicted Zn-dependent protease
MKTASFRFRFLSLTLLALSSVSGCSTLTKEPSDAEINAEAAKAYAEVKAKSKISTNAEWNAMVQRVSNRIAAASGEKFAWEAILIESPEANAWCMPGGKMAVYTGIMPILKNEGALAAVMGHEVAHATRRHGKQQYARAQKSNLIGLAVVGASIVGGQVLCKSDSCKAIAGLSGAAAGFALTFFDRKFSRADETDADRFGQLYMAKAGYDPQESIHLWERMGAANAGKAPPEFMSTHPSDTTRRGNLQSWMSEAQQQYQQAPQKYGTGELIR